MDLNLRNTEETNTEILHQVFDQSTEGFQVIDKNWKYVYVNETVAKHGRSHVNDLVGYTMMEKYPGIEKTDLFEQLKKCMDEKVGIRMENEFVFPGGAIGWFQLFIHPWSGGIMIFSIDITHRKLAQQQLIKTIENFEGAAASEGDRKNLEEVKIALENIDKPSITIIS